MSAYTKPIIRFGLITPVLFNGILLLGVAAAMTKLATVRAEKVMRYEDETQRVAAMKVMESRIAPRRKSFDDHKKLLGADPGQLFTKILDTSLPKYKSLELERSSLVFPQDRGRVGKSVKCDLMRVKASYQGGIGPMQESLLQVESLMPQAMLEELKITRKSDLLMKRPDFLVMEMTHACWKAGEARP
ncbi:MAG: hypothetical protein ACAI34_02235 [Verrucomicrobium sp.]